MLASMHQCAILCTAHESGAFSTPPIPYIAPSNSVSRRILWSHSIQCTKARPKSSLDLALTEEFIQMKANDNISNDDTPTTNPQETPRSISDTLGSTALSIVQSFARVVGSAGIDPVDDPNNNMGVEEYSADGFNKGAYGIANVFSGREPASRRARFIKWQRQSLSDVRKDVMRGAMGKEEAESRISPLIAALPSSQKAASKRDNNNKINSEKDQTIITQALDTLEKDMALLDNLASLKPQLSGTEVGLLLGAVLASGIGPILFPGTSVTEVLAPAAAAFTASITIGSEYIGRVAVADGKEIAANSIQCAAEGEAFLANAERVKAITPLCVGVGATCASFALLTPTIIDAINIGNSAIMITELYLLCPLISVLAAAVSNLALEETKGFASKAVNVGVRRFSKSGMVGRTWLSSSEQVQKTSKAKTDRWWSFAGSVLPAPIIGSILGGPSLSAKCIVVAALAAAQSAYFLAQAESVVARATDAVALKARSAAVCDTYANQGARNSAILPFTSALSAFCAAATAATVELPILDTISSLYGTMGEVIVVSAFPILSSAFASAAAVSKARCEVDAEAAAQAASTLALENDSMNGSGEDPVLRPFKAVGELVQLAVSSWWKSIKKGVISPFGNIWRIILGFRWRRRSNNGGGRWIEGGEGLA